MNVRAAVAAALCAGMAVAGCDMRSPGKTTSTTTVTSQTCMHRVMDAATRARFEQALTAKSVKYEVVEPTDGQGGVFLRAHDADCVALDEVQRAVVPSAPPGKSADPYATPPKS